MTAIVTNVSSASPGGTLPGEAHEKQLQAEVRCRVPEHSIREYTVPNKATMKDTGFSAAMRLHQRISESLVFLKLRLFGFVDQESPPQTHSAFSQCCLWCP